MSTTKFYIDGKERSFSIENAPEFKFGKDQLFSTQETDLTFYQDWYQTGYIEKDFLDTEKFNFLKKGLEDSIGNIIKRETGVDTSGFNLENYHHFVKTDADHMKVVSKTRDLFPDDFNFPIAELMPQLGKILNLNLINIDPKTKESLHIIVRINRPQSNDYNPPHKDVYEEVDKNNYVPSFVNFWIPIAGVTEKSSLPMAPNSHLINENLIERTFEGGKIEGNQYRVRMIKSWDGKNDLVRSKVKYGQVLIFTPHLVHGLATNEEQDKTRVALEFRLFKA